MNFKNISILRRFTCLNYIDVGSTPTISTTTKTTLAGGFLFRLFFFYVWINTTDY